MVPFEIIYIVYIVGPFTFLEENWRQLFQIWPNIFMLLASHVVFLYEKLVGEMPLSEEDLVT